MCDTVLDLFSTSDGSLPGIDISNLTGPEVMAAYKLLRVGSTVVPPDASIWCLDPEGGKQVLDVDDPAGLVVTGVAEPFHHCLERVTVDDVVLPTLGVFVFPDSIEVDYRPGRDWDAPKVKALFQLLLSIKRAAPDANLSLEDEVAAPASNLFRKAWDAFLASAGAP